MYLEAIQHRVQSNDAYLVAENKVLLKLKSKKGDLKQVKLFYCDKYKEIHGREEIKSVVLESKYSDDLFEYYEAIIEFDGISLAYYFQLDDGTERLNFCREGFTKEEVTEEGEMFIMANFSPDNLFTIPAWHREAVVYQIFPDRFQRGSDFSVTEKVTADWNTELEYDTFLGGNLRGIIEELDYLKKLGINTIYLNPIFKSNSTHRYDINDYYEIDPLLGTKDDFKELVEKAHAKGMKIILDAVFNHCGLDFFAFEDVVENGRESEYTDWFEIHDYPVTKEATKNPNYKTFGYHYRMPKLILSNPETADYFLEVARYWTEEFNIDGWRLDVADEISPKFWQQFREEVKSINPEILISGEIWYDSNFWLQGDQFDSVMNYPFLEAVEDFFAENSITPQEFSNQLGEIRSLYKQKAHQNLWNLIDSHDVSRFLYKCDNQIKSFKLAVLFQMTYIGVPVIYYGDEIAMLGGPRPLKRESMIWEQEERNQTVLDYYKKLLEIRTDNPELIYGQFEELVIDEVNNVYGYQREYNNQVTIIYLNNSKQAVELELEEEYFDLLSEENVRQQFELAAKEAVILK
ncbi:MAG: alpha amylase N-terminal ig-like domain-containing protein [Halanaerobiales bacterium]